MTIYPFPQRQKNVKTDFFLAQKIQVEVIFIYISNLKNVQADIAIDINIGVEASSLELDLWRLERIVIGERE